MTQTERMKVTCATRGDFFSYLKDHGAALLKRAAKKALALFLQGQMRGMISVDELAGVIFDKIIQVLDEGTLIRDLECFVWTTATLVVRAMRRKLKRDDAKVEALSAETQSAEWRSPERRIVAKDLLEKLVRGLSAKERAALVLGLKANGGLSPAQRTALCRARKRAKALLADLNGEAGNCLSDLIRWACMLRTGRSSISQAKAMAHKYLNTGRSSIIMRINNLASGRVSVS